MDRVKMLLRQEVEKYAAGGRGASVLLFPILDDEHAIYAVNAVGYPARNDVADVVILARLVDNLVIIEEDMTDKKLVDALVQQGIPRDHIILAYNGEPVPDIER